MKASLTRRMAKRGRGEMPEERRENVGLVGKPAAPLSLSLSAISKLETGSPYGGEDTKESFTFLFPLFYSQRMNSEVYGSRTRFSDILH